MDPRVFVLCVLVLVAASHAARLPRQSKFTTRYDNINIDDILKSDRLLNSYTKCLLDKGKCTPDGAELKKSLPDALKSACSQCSEKQRNGSEKVLRFIIKNRPDTFTDLERKYDPTGIYKKKYDAEFKELTKTV